MTFAKINSITEINGKPLRFTDKQLVSLILPLVLEQLLAISVGLADSLMVSTVGDAAISAVSLVDAISNLMIYLFVAMATGGAAVCGQYIGKKEMDNANKAGHHLLLMIAVISLVLTGLLYLFKIPLLTAIFGQIEPEVMAAVNTYYTIVMASIPAIALYNGGAAIFRTIRRSDLTLKASILMNAINVLGNALLIFGLKCGVEGVAIPTLVSRYVAAILMLGLLCNRKYMLNLLGMKHFRFNMAMMKNIMYIGIPSGFENCMFYAGRLILFSLISTFGTASIVANAIGNTLGGFHLFAGAGTASGLGTVISQCVGAKDYDQARYYMKRVGAACYFMLTVINIAELIVLPFIMHIYNVSPEAEHLAYIVVWLHGIAAMVLWTPAFLIPAFLRATGDAMYCLKTCIITMWVFRVMMAFAMGKFFGAGVVGVWVAHTVFDWIARTILFIRRYRSDIWVTKGIK